VGEPNQKGAFFTHSAEQIRLAGYFEENLLQQIARILFVTGEVQEKREQGLGVFVVPPLKLEITRHRFRLNDAACSRICL
jgi:hypothetical protein